MAQLKTRLKIALDETRMLVLGTQVLLGFQFRAVMEPAFSREPWATQCVHLVGTLMLLAAFVMLLVPGALHRLVARGEPTKWMVHTCYRVMDPVVALFGGAFALDMFKAFEHELGALRGIFAAAGFLAIAYGLFFGVGFIQRRRRAGRIQELQQMEHRKESKEDEQASISDKISQLLTEARVVLPGAQALLGFQFATVLMPGFGAMPASARYLHLFAMFAIGVATVMLMSPAVYHRLVERGQMTEHFHKVGSGIVVASMVPLALGLSADLSVVFWKVTDSAKLGVGTGITAFVVMMAAWFGISLLMRRRHVHDATPRREAHA